MIAMSYDFGEWQKRLEKGGEKGRFKNSQEVETMTLENSLILSKS